MVHTHKHPWLCIALYTTVNVVVTYGDFLYISVQARTYLNRIKQDGLNPYSTMTLRSVTRNHMLINSALRFSQADCPFRVFLKKIHLLQWLPLGTGITCVLFSDFRRKDGRKSFRSFPIYQFMCGMSFASHTDANINVLPSSSCFITLLEISHQAGLNLNFLQSWLNYHEKTTTVRSLRENRILS